MILVTIYDDSNLESTCFPFSITWSYNPFLNKLINILISLSKDWCVLTNVDLFNLFLIFSTTLFQQPILVCSITWTDLYQILCSFSFDQYHSLPFPCGSIKQVSLPIEPAMCTVVLLTLTTWSQASIKLANPSISLKLSISSNLKISTPYLSLNDALSSEVSEYCKSTKVISGSNKRSLRSSKLIDFFWPIVSFLLTQDIPHIFLPFGNSCFIFCVRDLSTAR